MSDSINLNETGILSTSASEAAESIKFLNFTDIKVDFGRNPRKESSYANDKMNWLARNLSMHGLMDALMVSLRADGSYWLVKGHRRLRAMIQLRTTGVPEGKQKKDEPAIAADPNAFNKVKCRVLKGMTIQDELDQLMDHIGVVGLDDQEKYLTAKIMTRAGFGHAIIASKLGTSRSNYSNGLARVLQMPACVEEAYLNEDPKAKKPTQTLFKELYPAYQADQKLPGARMKEAGPKFTEIWEAWLNGDTGSGPKTLARKTLTDIAGTIQDDDIRDMLQAILGNSANDLGDAITRIETRLSQGCDTIGTGVVTYSEGIASTVGE